MTNVPLHHIIQATPEIPTSSGLQFRIIQLKISSNLTEYQNKRQQNVGGTYRKI